MEYKEIPDACTNINKQVRDDLRLLELFRLKLMKLDQFANKSCLSLSYRYERKSYTADRHTT
ncbi:hypothetical protein D3C84_961180 [compost metagenome]